MSIGSARRIAMMATSLISGCAACQTIAFAQASLAGTNPIVVTAEPPISEADRSSEWKRAETNNVVVYSDGSEDQITRIAENLDKLHDLLVKLYRSRGHGEEPPPLTVVLFDTPKRMQELGLRSVRFGEGAFAKPFREQRYYDPREEGSILAVARVDQMIELNTGKARNADCEDLAANGEDCVGKKTFHPPVRRSWEAVLYGAYAQHLMLNYAPAPYPHWYVDGIGALFSTVVFKQDGSIEYGRPPQEGYNSVLRSYGRLDTEGVLTGNYLHAPTTRMEWTPYHAGLLVHFFVLSNLAAKERTQFAQYMAAIAMGKPMSEAARAFGSMKKLRVDVMSYVGRHHTFAQTKKAAGPARPVVKPLSGAAVERLMATLAPRL